MSTEEFPQPTLTEYEAPYDVSKRLGEDFVLAQHSAGFSTARHSRCSSRPARRALGREPIGSRREARCPAALAAATAKAPASRVSDRAFIRR